MTSQGSKPIEIYCALMEEAKQRIGVLRRFTSGNITVGRPDFDAETLCVHFRKILEIIAFSSLVAHRTVYESTHSDIQSRWRAGQILDRIEKVHANFYPSAVLPRRTDTGWHMDAVGDPVLTRDEFQTLYDKCGDMLHFWNPYRAGPREMDFGRSINEWCDLIENLLRHHIVWMHSSIGDGEGWLVYLSRPDDGKAYAVLFAPLSGQASSGS